MATLHVNEAVSKVRREPFIRDVHVLCRTRMYEWYSSRPILYVSSLRRVLFFPI